MNNFRKRPLSEMPREKLLLSGANVLSDAELVAIILQTGTKGKDVYELAVELINTFNGISGIEKAGIDELWKVSGLNKAKISKLKASIEIGRRVLYSTRRVNNKITNSKNAYTLLEPILKGLSKESFMVILLNSRNDVIDIKRVGNGTVNAASVYPREIIELVIRSTATGIILSHNHPSGNINPSPEDKRLTMNMFVVCELSGIAFHDHIIIGNDGFFSFADGGMLLSMKQQLTGMMLS